MESGVPGDSATVADHVPPGDLNGPSGGGARWWVIMVLLPCVLAVISMMPSAIEAMTSQPAPETGPYVVSQPAAGHAESSVRHVATVAFTEGKGLKTRTGPGTSHPLGIPHTLPEGAMIAVLCQDRHGEPFRDPTGDSRRYDQAWPVWNRLADGNWVSDLYVDLPKIPGDVPPRGIPRCEDIGLPGTR